MVSHAEAKCRHNINQSGEGEKEREEGSKEGGGRKGRRGKGFARTLYQELSFSWDLRRRVVFSGYDHDDDGGDQYFHLLMFLQATL